MDLEPIGESVSMEQLKEKLKQRFPDYNFDKTPEPDRRHKAPSLCKVSIVNYYDTEGNMFCGQRYKLQDPNVSHRWEWATCNALIKAANETTQVEHREAQEDLF